jgi:hypothetical protein
MCSCRVLMLTFEVALGLLFRSLRTKIGSSISIFGLNFARYDGEHRSKPLFCVEVYEFS